MVENHYYEHLVHQLVQGHLKTQSFLANELLKIEHIECAKTVEIDGGIIPLLLLMISENNPESLFVPLSHLQHFSRMEENCV